MEVSAEDIQNTSMQGNVSCGGSQFSVSKKAKLVTLVRKLQDLISLTQAHTELLHLVTLPLLLVQLQLLHHPHPVPTQMLP